MDKIFVKNYEDPTPGSDEILIRIRATSLNFHDFALVSGMISTGEGRIPMSGGAGEVVAIGEGVSRFSAGDSVVSLFFPCWGRGEPDLSCLTGVPEDQVDGFAVEYVLMPETTFTFAPQNYSHEESATLPCAALTA